jgi:hypothetical protein
MSKNSQSDPEINACWEMGDVHMMSTVDVLRGSHAFQHNFQLFSTQRCALCWKFLVSLEFRDRHSLFIAVTPLSHWLSLHTPKSLSVPHRKKSRLLRSADCAGSASCPVLTKVWFRCCLTMRRKIRWYPIMYEPHVLSLTKRHMFQEYW